MPSKARVSKFLPAVPRKKAKASYEPRQKPRQARAQVTFESILDATARILEDLGYRSLTTNGIAGVAGVAVGAVYEYFPNKESIVAELVRRTVRQILEEVEHAFEGATKVSGKEEAIEMLVRTCMQVLRRRMSLWKVFMEQVPFFWEIDELRAFPLRLYELAWRSRSVAKPDILDSNRRAMAYLYLLVPIGRWVPYAALVDRPSWLSEKDAENATIEIFKRLLT